MTLEAAPEPRDSSAQPGRLSISGLLALAAVAAVLVVVSVPRMHGMAVQENEVDARATARLLGLALRTATGEPEPTLAELLQRPELAGIRADGELLDHGRLLRRHGYLFELTRLPPSVALLTAPLVLLPCSSKPASRPSAVRAWPWNAGSTGTAAFLATDTGAVLRNENSPPHCEGLRAAPQACIPPDGWCPVD